MNLLLATENLNKVREFGRDLGPKINLLNLKDVGFRGSLPLETGTTYDENAAIKALYVGEQMQMLCLADDSGFEVVALEGQPGVFSARFMGGEPALQRAEILKRLSLLSGRRAAFVCSLCLYSPTSKTKNYFRGRVEGRVSFEERGAQGFGYDSIFIPEGFELTFAEMSEAEKMKISHRGQALVQLRNFLEAFKL